MRRPAILIPAGLALIALLAGGAAYAYFFSGLRSAPKPLALASPTASAPGPAAAAGGGPVGTWKIASGSQAGYRVKEQFVGQSSSHEAVARTSGVSGGMTLAAAASGYRADALTVEVDLTGLHSVDQVAGYDVTRRDFFVNRSLSTSQYPKATFSAGGTPVPADLAGGRAASFSLPGQLTIHGTTRPAEAAVQAKLAGGSLQVAGTIAIVMTDYGVSPPQVPFTAAEPGVTIEFQLVLQR